MSNVVSTRVLVAALAGALYVPLAVAAPPTLPDSVGQGWQVIVRILDANGDGVVAREELEAFPLMSLVNLRQSYRAMDGDNDQRLNLEEYLAYHGREQGLLLERFNHADADGSGGLSAAELQKAQGHLFDRMRREFAAMDADRNGEITWEERLQFLNSRPGGPALATTGPAAAPPPGAVSGGETPVVTTPGDQPAQTVPSDGPAGGAATTPGEDQGVTNK